MLCDIKTISSPAGPGGPIRPGAITPSPACGALFSGAFGGLSLQHRHHGERIGSGKHKKSPHHRGDPVVLEEDISGEIAAGIRENTEEQARKNDRGKDRDDVSERDLK